MSRFAVVADWESAPHLSDQAKREMLSAIPEHERKARTQGVAAFGAGLIYPMDESEFVIDPIQIPAWYRRAYGLDVGWNRTAAVWGAWDPDSDILILWSEYYRGMAEPPIHADAIRARGAWIPGVIDPAARGRGQKDGEQLYLQYTDPDSGRLNLTMANNKVTGEEGGLYAVLTRLTTGRLKVFRTLTNWLGEYRLYRRNEKGQIVKENDHLMDATRYLVMSGIARSVPLPADQWAENLPVGTQAKPKHQIDYNPMDSMFDTPGSFI